MDIIIISLTAINLFLTYRMLNYIYNLDRLRGPMGPPGPVGPMGPRGRDVNANVAVGYSSGPSGPRGFQGTEIHDGVPC